MIDIVVVRGAGDLVGDDVIDSLLTTEAVAVQRGKRELNANAHRSLNTEIEVGYDGTIKLGDHVRITNDEGDDPYDAFVRGILISGNQTEVFMRLSLEKFI